MSSTASNAVLTNSIDTITATGMTIGDATATSILLGSSTAGRTPTITIDTLSTLNSNANPAIAIGTSSSTKTIKIGSNSNSVHCSSIDLQGSAINNITGTTGAISIGNNQTDGILNLGTGVRTATGVVNIANGASNACAINIMNGNTTAGSVNIANGTGATQTTAVNIGSGLTTGTVTIGNSSNAISLNGAVTLAKPLILGTTPSLTTQLGYTIYLGLTTSITSTTTPLLTITLPIGTWICSYAVRLVSSSGTSVVNGLNCYMNLATSTSAGLPREYAYSSPSYTAQTIGTVGIPNLSCVGTATIVNAVSQSLQLMPTTTIISGTCDYVGAANPQTYLMATRIA